MLPSRSESNEAKKSRRELQTPVNVHILSDHTVEETERLQKIFHRNPSHIRKNRSDGHQQADGYWYDRRGETRR